MGADQSNEKNSRFLHNFATTYHHVRQINDPRFGDISLFKNNTEELYVCTFEKISQSEDEYSEFMRQINERKEYDHPNLLILLAAHQVSGGKNICGEISKIKIFNEFYTYDLAVEFDSRKGRNDPMSEGEIIYMANSIISPCAFLQRKTIYHSDIRPFNMLLTPEGQIKISDNGLISSMTGYLKCLTQGNHNVYLAPELLKALERKEVRPKYNPFKADVFSTGLTLLQLTCLYDVRQCYDWQNYTINWDIINSLIQQASASLSPVLINMISRMVSVNPNDRPDFIELDQIIAPYRAGETLPQPNVQIVQEVAKPTNLQPEPAQIIQSQFVPQQPQYVQPEPVQPVQSQYIPQQTQYVQPEPAQILQSQFVPQQTQYVQPEPVQSQYVPQQTQYVAPQSSYIPQNQLSSQFQPNIGSYQSVPAQNYSAPLMYGQSTFGNPVNNGVTFGGEQTRLTDLDEKINQALMKSKATIEKHEHFKKDHPF